MSFKATHNSFAGGQRGSIPQQLDAGIRCVELDVHATTEGFRVGHMAPGHSVMLGSGNPSNLEIQSWLAQIAQWSEGHRSHLPITLVFDLKTPLIPAMDDLWRDPATMGLFGATAIDCLGDRIVASDIASWPDVSALLGMVVLVVSGHHSVRAIVEKHPLNEMVFVERQFSGTAGGDLVVAGPSESISSLAGERCNAATRVWGYSQRDCYWEMPTFPATDTPYADWYAAQFTSK